MKCLHEPCIDGLAIKRGVGKAQQLRGPQKAFACGGGVTFDQCGIAFHDSPRKSAEGVEERPVVARFHLRNDCVQLAVVDGAVRRDANGPLREILVNWVVKKCHRGCLLD